MSINSEYNNFGFQIDFIKDSSNPERVFRTFLGLIDFCETTHKLLIKSLDIKATPTLRLREIEQGSIKVFLQTIINLSDSENLSLKLIYDYLNKARSLIIEFVNKRHKINSYSEIKELQNRLKSLAEETNSNPLGIYQSINDKELLDIIDKFQKPCLELQAGDKLAYLVNNKKLIINRDFVLSEQDKEYLLVKETRESELEMILKVKKPDYLGDSKWEFRYQKRIINIKFNDSEWLSKFRQKLVIIAPGDAIKAKVKIIEQYDHEYELISIEYTLNKVLDIIYNVPEKQLSLLPDSKNRTEDEN